MAEARAEAFTGVLLTCDPQLKQFILSLNDSRGQRDQFVIRDLDETHLFVHAESVKTIEKELQAFKKENTYEQQS